MAMALSPLRVKDDELVSVISAFHKSGLSQDIICKEALDAADPDLPDRIHGLVWGIFPETSGDIWGASLFVLRASDVMDRRFALLPPVDLPSKMAKCSPFQKKKEKVGNGSPPSKRPSYQVTPSKHLFESTVVASESNKIDGHDLDCDLGCTPLSEDSHNFENPAEGPAMDSDTVMISNMPREWKKLHTTLLEAAIMKGMEDAEYCEEDDNIIKSADDFNAAEATVSLVFINKEYARLCCMLDNVKCDGYTLKFKMSSTNVTSWDLLGATDTVLVKELPRQWKKFHSRVLKAAIMRSMEEAQYCGEDDIIKSLLNYNEDDATASVVFMNTEYANLCFLLTDVRCDGNILEFELVPKPTSARDSASPVDDKTSLLDVTDTVSVKNLPRKWQRVHVVLLKACIMRGMDEAHFCSEESEVITDVKDYNADEATASVVFINSELAKLCSFLRNVSCDDHILGFELVPSGTKKVVPEDKEMANSEDVQGSPISETDVQDCGEEEEDVDRVFADGDKIPLSSKEGGVIFMRNLIRLKLAFRSKNHTSALIRLDADIRKHENVDLATCSVAKLRAKRKYFMSEYNSCVQTNTRSWPHFTAMAVYMSHEQEDVLQGTNYHPSKCPAAAEADTPLYNMEKYTKGATWNEVAIEELVKAYLIYKDVFDNHPANRTYYYGKIQQILKGKGLYFEATRCESQMELLKREFRNEAKNVCQTGIPGPAELAEWPHYELMYPVMKDDVTVKPLVTVSAGMCRATTVTRADHASGSVLPLPRPPNASHEVTPLRVQRRSPHSAGNMTQRAIAALEKYNYLQEKKFDSNAR